MPSAFINRLRAEFITERLRDAGEITLPEMQRHFGISRATASKAMQQFFADHPAAMDYDKSVRRFVPGPRFQQHLEGN